MPAFNYTKFQMTNGDALGVNRMWIYTDLLTTLATITAAGYFDTVNEANPSAIIQVGDIIWVNASDETSFIEVTDIDPTITTEVFDAVLGVGAVGTNNIANLAVTAAKIANATITTTQISATAGIVGSQLANATVTATQLASDAVTTAKILDANVTTSKLADDAVTSAKLDQSTVQYVKVTVSAAEWNGMYAAPKLLIAAAGANTLIRVLQATYEVDFGSAAYANGGVFGLQYDNDVHGAGVAASATTAAAVAIGWVADATLTVAGALPDSAALDTVNKGIYISNLTGAFDTGDSPVDIHITYNIVTTTF